MPFDSVRERAHSLGLRSRVVPSGKNSCRTSDIEICDSGRDWNRSKGSDVSLVHVEVLVNLVGRQFGKSQTRKEKSGGFTGQMGA